MQGLVGSASFQRRFDPHVCYSTYYTRERCSRIRFFFVRYLTQHFSLLSRAFGCFPSPLVSLFESDECARTYPRPRSFSCAHRHPRTWSYSGSWVNCGPCSYGLTSRYVFARCGMCEGENHAGDLFVSPPCRFGGQSRGSRRRFHLHARLTGVGFAALRPNGSFSTP